MAANWPQIQKLEISSTDIGTNIWRLGEVRDTKFDKNASKKILLNAAKFQGYSFHRIHSFSELLRENQYKGWRGGEGGEGEGPKIRVKIL